MKNAGGNRKPDLMGPHDGTKQMSIRTGDTPMNFRGVFELRCYIGKYSYPSELNRSVRISDFDTLSTYTGMLGTYSDLV